MAKYSKNHAPVCILNPKEARELSIAGVLPSCLTHSHIPRREAQKLCETMLYFDGTRRHMEAYWVSGKRAILFHEARSWKVVARQYWGWQLVHGGGVR